MKLIILNYVIQVDHVVDGSGNFPVEFSGDLSFLGRVKEKVRSFLSGAIFLFTGPEPYGSFAKNTGLPVILH
jgi:hypothetical protein